MASNPPIILKVESIGVTCGTPQLEGTEVTIWEVEVGTTVEKAVVVIGIAVVVVPVRYDVVIGAIVDAIVAVDATVVFVVVVAVESVGNNVDTVGATVVVPIIAVVVGGIVAVVVDKGS